MARIRVICVLAVAALSACAIAGISPAVGARTAGSATAGARSANTRVHSPAHCVKTVRVHVGASYVLHRRSVQCRRRGARNCAKASQFRSSHRPSGHGRRSHTRCRRRHGAAPHKTTGPLHRRPSRAAAGGECPDAGLAPSDWNLDRIRAAVLCLVNRERAAHGEGALQPNGRLEQAAQSHTESMASRGYFEHDGPSGDTPLGRARAAGYIYSPQVGYEVAENIGWGSLWQGSPRAIVAAWMGSTGHRANILDPHFRDTAIGVSPHLPSAFAHGQSGGIYTQDFGVIITG